MEHMDTIQEIGYRCKAALENGNKILSVVMVALRRTLNI